MTTNLSDYNIKKSEEIFAFIRGVADIVLAKADDSSITMIKSFDKLREFNLGLTDIVESKIKSFIESKI